MRLLICSAVLCAWKSGAAAGGVEAKRPVSITLGTGVQYDSNVAVLDLDTAANAGDAAAQLDFGIGYDKPRNGGLGVSAGYNFSRSLHQDFDEFDIQIHRASAGLRYDLDRLDTGATFQYARAALDGNEFLLLTQASPFVSTLVGKRLFLRLAYAYSDKDFATNPGRDATSDTVSTDAFVFLNGLTTYLVFGLRYDAEDAMDGQFDYAGHRLRAQLSHRIRIASRELTLKAHLRYETRSYDAPTPSIGAPRNDSRYRFEATAELPLGTHVYTNVGYQYADNRSNLPSVDFDENVFSLGFRAEF